MTTTAAVLLGLTLAVAVVDWWAVASSKRSVELVAKPLTMVVLIAAALALDAGDTAVQLWIVAALVFSLGGDVFLMFAERGEQWFIAGLASFLIGHLAYIVAFTRGLRLAAKPLPFVTYALLAGAILSQLWPHVPAELRAPVLVYVVALACMAAQAAAVWLAARGSALEPWARRAAIGGALFMASDATLAINKFASPVPLASLWILATYWLAQPHLRTMLRCINGCVTQPGGRKR